MKVSDAGDSENAIVHIIRRDIVLNTPFSPVSASNRLHEEEGNSAPPSSSGGTEPLQSPSSVGSPRPVPLLFPELVVDVARDLLLHPNLETSSTQVTFLWELILLHFFPPQEGYKVVYGDAIPELTGILGDRHRGQSIVTLAVIRESVSLTAPCAVVLIHSTPQLRTMVHDGEADVLSCHDLLTQSRYMHDSLAPYSPYPYLLMITAHGHAPIKDDASPLSFYPFTSESPFIASLESLTESGFLSPPPPHNGVAPPAVRATLWPSRLTSEEARSLPEELVLQWSSLVDVLGLDVNPLARDTLLGFIQRLKTSDLDAGLRCNPPSPLTPYRHNANHSWARNNSHPPRELYSIPNPFLD